MYKNIKYFLSLGLLFLGSAVFTQYDNDLANSVADQKYIDLEYRGSADASNYVESVMCENLTSLAKSPLSAEEIEGLVFMREEEKLARDVYMKLFEKWQLKPFQNIYNSEQRHMDALLCLIEKYDITDPVGNNEIGKFSNQKLSELYTSLVRQGEKSLEAALEVGATIEDLDIFDLMNYELKTDNEDIKLAFTALKQGSENHLRAFSRNLNSRDVQYEAQYISTELLNEILSSPNSKGSALCGINNNKNNNQSRTQACNRNQRGKGNRGNVSNNQRRNRQSGNNKGCLQSNGKGQQGNNTNCKKTCTGSGQNNPGNN